MNTEQAVNMLSTHLEDVQQVDDQVLRGIKRYRDRPYAVFYVDISGNVEERAERLAQFQDRILGRWFFDEKNDLRWNSYLLFLADKSRFSESSFVHARRILETDRNYARKFVIPEDELALCLDSRLPTHEAAQPVTTDILRIWRAPLSEVGLEDIFDYEDIAPIVRKVVNGSPHAKTQASKGSAQPHDDVVATSFLRHIERKKFRTHPKQENFDLGTVNLISGVNGVGKTTLLEAIEFFYCGRNRRSNSPKGARVVATLKGNQREIETSTKTSQQTFRDRHLLWYGKLDIKRNLMPESFANFNFLNTDAAVHLSMDSDPNQFREDLATLMVGAEAGRVWDRIGRVYRDLQPESRALVDRLQAISAKIKAHEERLATAKSVVRKSDEFFALLKGHLAQAKWRRIPDTKEAAADENQTNIIEIESVLLSTSELSDLPANLTLDTLSVTLRKNKALLDRATELLTKFSAVGLKRHEVETMLKQRAVTSNELHELEQYVSAGFPELVATVDRLHREVMRLTAEIGGLEIKQVASDEIVSSTLPLLQMQLQIAQREKELEEAVQIARKLFEAFRHEQDRAASLSQQLRTIAQQILEGSVNQEVCPLCHTEFGPGELQQHILHEVDNAQEARAQEAWKAVESAEKKYVEAQQATKRVERLLDYCRRRKLKEHSVSSKEALEALAQDARDLAGIKRDLEQTQSRLHALESSGLDAQRLILLRTKYLPASSGSMNTETIKEALALNEKETSRLKSEISKLDDESKRLQNLLRELIEEANLAIEMDIKQAVNALQKRVNNLSLASDSIRGVGATLLVEEKSPLAGVLSTLRAASSVQEQLRQAHALESGADKSVAEANDALNKARKDETQVRASLKRVQDALAKLKEIIEKHSLEAATRELLGINRSQVAAIFSRIHSPHEFEVSTADSGYLQRIGTKEPINLKEISTGQRAAFALSIFLAMNVYAKKAPPIMLIDDPVAHVDDLNTLSFLDYLRDLAVTGERQIFFATADEKLAGLFEHKFSFLGDDFKKHPLTRD